MPHYPDLKYGMACIALPPPNKKNKQTRKQLIENISVQNKTEWFHVGEQILNEISDCAPMTTNNGPLLSFKLSKIVTLMLNIDYCHLQIVIHQSTRNPQIHHTVRIYIS